MGRSKFKYLFLIISIMILILFLIYFSYKLFFSKGYILSVNDKKDTKKVSEGSDVMWYILENGYSTSFKYIFLILGIVILIAINKELIDTFNQRESKE